MDLLLPLLFCFMVLGLRYYDGHRNNNQHPVNGEQLLILTATWFLTFIFNRFCVLFQHVRTLANETGSWYPIEGLNTLKLISEPGDQRIYVMGCVIITFGSLCTLIRLFPSTKHFLIPPEQKALSKANANLFNAQEELARANDKILANTEEARRQENEIEILRAKIESHRKERSAFKTIKKTAESLQSLLAEKSDEAALLAIEIKEMNSDREALVAKNEELLKRLADEKSRRNEAEKIVLDIKADNSTLNNRIEHLTAQNLFHKQGFDEISQQAENLKDSLAVALDDADLLRAELRKNKAALQKHSDSQAKLNAAKKLADSSHRACLLYTSDAADE